MRLQRQQPTRLPRPWDSPGKNTGVGCHFFLQCMKVKSESEVTQLCPTLSDPMDCSLPGSSVHGIFQARVLEWVAIAFIYVQIELYVNLSERRERDTKENSQDSLSERRFSIWSLECISRLAGLVALKHRSFEVAQKLSTHPPIGNIGWNITQPTLLGPIQGSLSILLIIICPFEKTGYRQKMYWYANIFGSSQHVHFSV